MLKFVPLVAVVGLLAACGNPHNHHADNSRGYYKDGRYYEAAPASGGKISSSDPLSERSLGSIRGAHNEHWENSRGNPDRDDREYRYVPVYDSYYHGGYYRRGL